VLGRCTKVLYKFISSNWQALNDTNFIEAKCFKVLTCDPLDDVVENFSALNVGVAIRYAQNQYSDKKWQQLFEALWSIHEVEDLMYQKLKEFERENLASRISQSISYEKKPPADIRTSCQV
jgi:hypothetical protein